MIIKTSTIMQDDTYKKVFRASNFDNNKYKTYKIVYNLTGLLIGMVWIRELVMYMTGRNSVGMPLLILMGAACIFCLYTGMTGMDKNIRQYKKIYGPMSGHTFIYEIDSSNINVICDDGDIDEISWREVVKWEEDMDYIFLFFNDLEALVLSKKDFSEGTSKDMKELCEAVMQDRRSDGLKQLGQGMAEQIYNTEMVKDFPESELKPLKMILSGMERGVYEVMGYYKEQKLAAYCYFIKSTVSDTLLLDYFAVTGEMRNNGIGSEVLEQLKAYAVNAGKQLILEVENPEYEKNEEKRTLMERRIGFYKRNGMKLSGVSCTFADNEYRIFYLGDEQTNEQVKNITEEIYRNFFGNEFIDKNCRFHDMTD